MIRYASSRPFKTIPILVLALILALSANMALGAPEVMAQSTTLQLQSTQEAGDATSQVQYEAVTDANGNAVVDFHAQIEGLDDRAGLLLVLVGEEGSQVAGGELDEEGNVQVPVENLNQFRAIAVGRVQDDGEAQVLFVAELPGSEESANTQ